MDKFGVVIDDDKSKTASKDRTCPKCGTQLPTVGGAMNPSWCPKCGTEPFEKRPEQRK